MLPLFSNNQKIFHSTSAEDTILADRSGGLGDFADMQKEGEMLKPGQRINLTYYEGATQIESYGWLVEEYDDGLLKAYNPGGKMRLVSKRAGGAIIEEWVECEASESVIFNLRSTGFLKAELVV